MQQLFCLQSGKSARKNENMKENSYRDLLV